MGEARRKKIQAAVKGVTEILAESGRMVEVGFEVHAMYYLPKDMTPEQREDYRECFIMGAHHLFSSIMNVLDDSTDESTPDDERRMTMAYEELENFIRHFKRRHGVGDELYPQRPVSARQ